MESVGSRHTISARGSGTCLASLQDRDAGRLRVIISQIVGAGRSSKTGANDDNILLGRELLGATVRVELVQLCSPEGHRGVGDGKDGLDW